jgi:UDP-N-acetylmuramoyl-L-alanyl-D-glutamate--2,6-diaminopimelate ligase
MIPIRDILARLESHGLLASAGPDTDLAIEGITDDSRKVRAGSLFVAIRGHREDGHDHLRDAAEAGAAAAIVETPNTELNLPQFRVTDGRRAAAIAASVVFGDPWTRLTLIGVTGTNGKTTTVHIARHVLSQQRPTASMGTLGVIDTAGVREAIQLTTPGPIEFQRRLSELAAAGATCVVAEVSSHALAQSRVAGASFDVAAFTNLTRDHLDYHADLDDYRHTKLRLVDLLGGDGTLVVNADEPAWAVMPGSHRRISYGIRAEADCAARNVELSGLGSSWTLVTGGAEYEVRSSLAGEFNVSNALAAVSVAAALDLDMAVTADALATVPPVPGRLESIASDPRVLRDYAHTPDALGRALGALRPAVRGRLIVVFGCGGDRDPGKRPLMGRAAAAAADYSIVTSDNPRSEPPEAVIADILPGLAGAPHEVIVDRRAAIARALELAGADDVILLAGKGHEDYQIIGDVRRPFDEAEVVAELLAEGAGGAG